MEAVSVPPFERFYEENRGVDLGHLRRLLPGDAAEDAQMLAVLGDPTRLVQAIGNVLSNAAKYTERGGRITLAATESDTELVIRVRDNGIGIPPEVKERLFQPFFTTKPTGEGTGLGLSISYEIVTQQHGGTIEVGQFTEFTVRLPRSRHVTATGSTP